MSIPFISNTDALKNVTMKDAVQLMYSLFNQHLLAPFESHRHVTPIPDHDGLTLFMPAVHQAQKVLGIKISSIRPNNFDQPMVNGLYVLLDYNTGKPRALIDSNCITVLRTAAVTAVVVRSIVDTSQSQTLGIIGAGTQALAHAESLCQSISIQSLHVYSRTKEHTKSFLKKIGEKEWAPPFIKESDSLQDLLNNVSIVCTCTSTNQTTPLIKSNDIPKSICHISAIGGRTINALEVDPILYRNANVIVERAEEAMQDSGEIRQALNNNIISKSQLICITDLLKQARSSTFSIYRSVGLAIEDLFLAEYIAKSVLDNSNYIESSI